MAGIQPKKTLTTTTKYNLIQGSFASYAAINSQTAPKPLTKLYSHFRLDTKLVVCRQRSSLIQFKWQVSIPRRAKRDFEITPRKELMYQGRSTPMVS